MFETMIDLCFAGCETDLERLFAMCLMMFLLQVVADIIVCVCEGVKN